MKLYEDHPMRRGLIKPDACADPGPGIGLVHAYRAVKNARASR